jgi:membrane protease YdiL (CAAX protease family)
MIGIVLWCGGVLVWSAVANLVLGDTAYVARNLALTAVLVVYGVQRHGVHALGLARQDVRTGVIWGVAASAVVAVALVLAVPLAQVVPPIASLLGDQRATAVADGVLFVVLVRIPLGTALFEEVLFRGVLHAELETVLSRVAAIAVGAAVFGLWHVAPTMVALQENGVAVASAAGVGAIAGGVAVTAVAGVLFTWVRIASGSLVAPVLLHAVVNVGALLAALAYQRG